MALEGLLNIKKALHTLNPDQVRELSKKPVHISLQAAGEDGYRRLENFLLQDLRPSRRVESLNLLSRAGGPADADGHSLTIYDESALTPAGGLVYHPEAPAKLIDRVLKEYPDAGIALARSFQPFRQPFINQVIARTCRENVLFSVTTALPDIIPSVIQLPWAVAEFASDTAFLTMNQVRMAFMIAAASDREVGYLQQKSEVAGVIGSAFGWRALAKQVIGKVPFGGGLIGKAAVAYAGTKVMGVSLERLYSVGYIHSRGERERLYADAYQQGKKIAARVVTQIRPDLASRFADKSSEKPGEAPHTS